MISAVLFDLDGVLVAACDWHYEALNAALISFGKNPIDRQTHESTFNGLPTRVKLSMLGITGTEADQISDEKQRRTIDVIRSGTRIMPEKIELLSYLKERGIKLACVTNSIRKTAIEMLSSTGQIGFFDLIVTNEDVLRNKPYPDCYDHAILKLGVDPIKSLCAEDSPKGIEAARSSMAKYVWAVSDPSEVTLDNYTRFVNSIQ